MSGRDNFLRDVSWTRQPQNPVGVNRAHPFASKALLCVNVNTLVDVTKNQLPTINTPASQSIVSGIPGFGRAFTGNTTTGLLYSGRSTAATPKTTFVAVFSWAGAGGSNYPQLMGTSTVNNGIRIGDGVTGTGSTFGITKGGVANLGTVTLTANVPYVCIAGHDDASGAYYTTIRALTDGTISTVSGTSAGASNAPDGTYAVGISRTDYSGAWNGNIWMGAIFGEYFTEAQATHLLYNPWQLFAPLPRRIFVSGTSSGAYTLTAESGSFTLTGQAATLAKNSLLSAEAGSYTLTGQAATLAKNSVLTAEFGTYALTGQDATLTYTSFGAYTLTAETGTFSLSGQDATLLKSRILSGEFGAFTVTGQDASFTYVPGSTYTLTAEVGAFTLTGQAATLLKSKVITGEFGAFTFTGQSATLSYTGAYVPPADPPDFTMSFPGGSSQRIGGSSGADQTSRIGPSTASGSTQRILH